MRKLVATDPLLNGQEPTWAPDRSSSNAELIRALNWYSYSFNRKDAKEFVLDYMKETAKSKDEVAKIRSIPEQKIDLQFGWIARMLTMGHVANESTKSFFDQTYTKLINLDLKEKSKPVAVDVQAPVATVNVQQRIVEKAQDEAGELEGMIDDFVLSKCKMQIDIAAYFKSKKLSSIVMKKICDIFLPKAAEIAEALKGKDKQLAEGYSNFTKVELKKLKEFIEAIVAESNKTSIENKPIRKKRTVKQKSPKTLASKVSYLAEDATLQLKSLLPEKIIGASQVWTYNVKTKMLGVFFADNAKGLSIKGTTIQNFSAETSIGKRLRKPKDTIQELLDAGKIKLKKLMGTLSTKECELTGRLNSDTIIVKVLN